MSISLTQNNISPGHFMTSGNPEQKKYDRDNKSWILFSSILFQIVDTRLLTEGKTVLYTMITQSQKVAVSLIVSCEIYKPHHNLILGSSKFLSTQGTNSPSDRLVHYLLCIAGCCFLMPINAACCYKNERF